MLFVSGPTVSPGYRDPLQNAGVFTDGGLNTGDLAYFGADDKLFIAGRAKDVIIRSGHNIDPAMVEAAFERCPSVAMAAVVAQPDPYAGELPVAYVTLAPGAVAAEEELMAFARNHIAERPAWPKHVYIVDALPLTAVEKLYEPALRCDATVRLLKPILSDIAPAASVEVEARDGGKRGPWQRDSNQMASGETGAVQVALPPWCPPPLDRIASISDRPCDVKTSTWRSFAIISSGL